MTLAVIWSPPFDVLELGPLELRMYGLTIAVAVLAAVWLASRRWRARGGDGDDIASLATWAVPAGLIGARAYHVITEMDRYIDDPLRALELWRGGLGVPGGIAAGLACGLVVARRRGLDVPRLLDAVAPALSLAQAIGRWGNWFNQELFGRPTEVPWALAIAPENRPEGYISFETFHPTFLYESLWNLALLGGLLLADHALRLRPGRLFALYIAGYGVGRLWIEGIRIDAAHEVAGLRINEWMSLTLVAGVAVFFVLDGWRARRRVRDDEPALVGAER